MNTKCSTLITKGDSKTEQNNIVKLQMHDFSFFLGKIFLGDDTFKLKSLYTAFLHSIHFSGCAENKIKDDLAVEQNNSLTKVVNTYFLYDLDVWPRIPTNNFKLISAI